MRRHYKVCIIYFWPQWLEVCTCTKHEQFLLELSMVQRSLLPKASSVFNLYNYCLKCGLDQSTQSKCKLIAFMYMIVLKYYVSLSM